MSWPRPMHARVIERAPSRGRLKVSHSTPLIVCWPMYLLIWRNVLRSHHITSHCMLASDQAHRGSSGYGGNTLVHWKLLLMSTYTASVTFCNTLTQQCHGCLSVPANRGVVAELQPSKAVRDPVQLHGVSAASHATWKHRPAGRPRCSRRRRGPPAAVCRPWSSVVGSCSLKQASFIYSTN